MITLDNTKTLFAIVSTVIAIAGGSYTFLDKIGWNKEILTWVPEDFEVNNATADGEFRAVISRIKHRGDCDTKHIELKIIDSTFMTYKATPHITAISGPVSDKPVKIGFKFYVQEMDIDKISTGTARLIGTLRYECPEGTVYVHSPDHENLEFEILPE